MHLPSLFYLPVNGEEGKFYDFTENSDPLENLKKNFTTRFEPKIILNALMQIEWRSVLNNQ